MELSKKQIAWQLLSEKLASLREQESEWRENYESRFDFPSFGMELIFGPWPEWSKHPDWTGLGFALNGWEFLLFEGGQTQANLRRVAQETLAEARVFARGPEDPVTLGCVEGDKEVRKATADECALAQEALRKLLELSERCQEYLSTHSADREEMDVLHQLKRILDEQATEKEERELERIPLSWYQIAVAICGGEDACPWLPIDAE